MTLSKAAAFNPGSELWLLPELEQSRWTQLVDWYLNFIISRAHKYTTPSLSPKLQSIIETYKLPLQPIKPGKSVPMLFSSEGRLPSRQTIILKYHDSMEEWLDKSSNIWQKLNRPRLRIFLPDDISEKDFNKLWPQSDPATAIELVNQYK